MTAIKTTSHKHQLKKTGDQCWHYLERMCIDVEKRLPEVTKIDINCQFPKPSGSDFKDIKNRRILSKNFNKEDYKVCMSPRESM